MPAGRRDKTGRTQPPRTNLGKAATMNTQQIGKLSIAVPFILLFAGIGGSLTACSMTVYSTPTIRHDVHPEPRRREVTRPALKAILIAFSSSYRTVIRRADRVAQHPQQNCREDVARNHKKHRKNDNLNERVRTGRREKSQNNGHGNASSSRFRDGKKSQREMNWNTYRSTATTARMKARQGNRSDNRGAQRTRDEWSVDRRHVETQTRKNPPQSDENRYPSRKTDRRWRQQKDTPGMQTRR